MSDTLRKQIIRELLRMTLHAVVSRLEKLRKLAKMLQILETKCPCGLAVEAGGLMPSIVSRRFGNNLQQLCKAGIIQTLSSSIRPACLVCFPTEVVSYCQSNKWLTRQLINP
jgi:hypothetical protein